MYGHDGSNSHTVHRVQLVTQLTSFTVLVVNATAFMTDGIVCGVNAPVDSASGTAVIIGLETLLLLLLLLLLLASAAAGILTNLASIL